MFRDLFSDSSLMEIKINQDDAIFNPWGFSSENITASYSNFGLEKIEMPDIDEFPIKAYEKFIAPSSPPMQPFLPVIEEDNDGLLASEAESQSKNNLSFCARLGRKPSYKITSLSRVDYITGEIPISEDQKCITREAFCNRFFRFVDTKKPLDRAEKRQITFQNNKWYCGDREVKRFYPDKRCRAALKKKPSILKKNTSIFFAEKTKYPPKHDSLAPSIGYKKR